MDTSKLLYSAIETSDMGFALLGRKYQFLELNRALAEMLGMSVEDANGKNFSHLFPDDQTALFEQQCEILEQQKKCLFQSELRSLQGQRVPVSISISKPLHKSDKLVVFVHDLSEQKSQEAELERLSLAVEQSYNSVMITNDQGIIEYVNPAFCKTSGYSKSEVIGHKPSMLQSGLQDESFYRSLWKCLNKGQVWQGEFVNRRKNGELYVDITTISPIRNQRGNITHYIAIREDVTVFRQTQERLHQQTQLLDILRTSLVEFMSNGNLSKVSDSLLHSLLNLTQSQFGFIGEIIRDAQTQEPSIQIHAISDIRWDNSSHMLYQQAQKGKLVFRDMDTLFGEVIKTQQPVFSLDPSSDPRASGALPPGHPTLRSFFGMPIFYGNTLVGMYAVANRSGGYTPSIAEFLAPFHATYGSMIHHQQLLRRETKTQQALRWERDFNQAVVNHAASIVAVLDLQGNIVRFNKTAEKLTGFSAEEVIGRPVWESVIPHAIRSTVRHVFDNIIEGNMISRYENPWLTKSGNLVDLDWSNSVLYNEAGECEYLLAIGMDIRDRRRKESIILRREESLRALNEINALASLDVDTQLAHGLALGAAYFNLDIGLICQQQDEHCSLIHSLIPNELNFPSREKQELAEACAELHINKDDVLAILDLAQESYRANACFQKFKLNTYIGVKLHAGKQFRGILCFSSIYPNPHPFDEGDLGFMRLLGRWASAALERHHNAEALRQAKDAAEAANHAKSSFLANISHELRTPLNAVLGYSQILQRSTNLDDTQRRGLDAIHHSGDYLLTLINDILDLAKIEAGRFELVSHACDLRGLCHSLSHLFKLRAQGKGISFEWECPELLPSVDADEKRLRQILINLLGNAVKFTESGGVVLHTEYQNEQLKITINDTGIGIDSLHLERIFEPFSQAGDAAYKAQGTGLGLAITRKLVSMMGGEIKVTSQPGQGSCFVIELPLQENKTYVPPPVLDFRSAKSYLRETGQGPYRVLVVDDIEMNRNLLSSMLTELGFEVQSAVDGFSCLNQLEQIQPDLILMDLVMPGIDGLETCRRIKQRPKYQQLPIIAVSARAFPEDRQKCLDAGCIEHIAKPVDILKLQAALQRSLALQWVYEDIHQHLEAKTAQESMQPNANAGVNKDCSEQAERLLKLSKAGDIGAIRRTLQELEALPDCQLPVQTLRDLAENFNIKGLRNLLEQYLDPSHS